MLESGEADPERERYLSALPTEQQALLARVNAVGLALLRELFDRGEAVAFLGAGASAPLYPLWNRAIAELIDVAAGRLEASAAMTLKAMAETMPGAVVQVLRRNLGADYREALRKLFGPRRDPDTQLMWTPTHERIVRSNFAGIVTTNYDAGIVNARMAVRRDAAGTGFSSWTDDDALDRWRTRDVFGDDELPVLYAHGHHNQPGDIVLATAEYRRAYVGKLSPVLHQLLDGGHVVWIGFSFADQRIATVLREIGDRSGTPIELGQTPRHVAVMPWNPEAVDEADDDAVLDPDTIRSLIEIEFGARVVLYPAPGGDHSALQQLLEAHTDPRFPRAGAPQPSAPPPIALATAEPASAVAEAAPTVAARAAAAGPTVAWIHGGVPLEHFTGRTEELTWLDRWADDSGVRLVGVTAWGGSGKTALVTEWVERLGGTARRPAIRGVFAWSFNENSSAEEWAEQLLTWAAETFDVAPATGALAGRVLAVARQVPLLLILDGLEMLQEGPAGSQFGRLLDGTLRDVLTGLCGIDGEGLAILTSRFPFADLEQFDGGAARMLDVPPFTPQEGARLLARAGGDALSEQERVELVEAVDGHALAVGALAGMLGDGLATGDVRALRQQLREAGQTDARVSRVLAFYSERLNADDRQLIAIVSLFQRPVSVTTILALGSEDLLGAPLEGWTAVDVETATRQRATGLLTWHPNATISAHPLVRDTFRQLVLSGQAARQASTIALADLPHGAVESREDGLRVIEMIELLIDGGEWDAADALVRARANNSRVWMNLPAARLGQRCAIAFVATDERREACLTQLSRKRRSFYLHDVGMFAMYTGDLVTAERFLRDACEEDRLLDDDLNHVTSLSALAACLTAQGDIERSHLVAEEALRRATAIDDWSRIRNTLAYVGEALHLSGLTAEAELRFLDADAIELAHDRDNDHLHSMRGVRWAAFLLSTGRSSIARRLTERNLEISEQYGWNDVLPNCDQMLGHCALLDDDLVAAELHLGRAAETFRSGDFLIEWAATLPHLAELRRREGRLDDAERLCAETVGFAGPRAALPVHAAAIVTRARIRGDRFAQSGNPNDLARAREDAEHAHRMSTRVRRLPWLELDALEAHALIDLVAETDHAWAARAHELRATLIPPGLDPDPLSTTIARAAGEPEPEPEMEM